MTQPDATNQGTSGHGLDEDEKSQLDAYDVDKLDHTKSLTFAQRQHFITSKTTEATLLTLNEQIAKRNELRRTSNENARIMGPVEIALPMPTRSASGDLASLFSRKSPDEQKALISQLQLMMAPDTASVSFTTEVSSRVAANVFDDDQEGTPSMSYAVSFNQVPSQINVLKTERCYLPLTLFTNSAWKSMLSSAETLIHEKRPDPEGGKAKMVLGVGQFGTEVLMSQPVWLEAYKNYFTFLRSCKGAHIVTRWEDHHAWIKSRADFRTRFGTYLQFDIMERTAYMKNPTAFSEESYRAKFQEVMLLSLAPEIDNDTSHLPMRKGSQNPSPHKKKPYDRNDIAGTSSKPFPSGSSSAGTSNCLICSRAGHRFQSCDSVSFPDGSPLFAKADGKSLISVEHLVKLCIGWNVGGDKFCRSHPPAIKIEHRCSFCGDANHFAFAWSCRKTN